MVIRELGKRRGLENRISETLKSGVWVWVIKMGHNAPHPTPIIKATTQGMSLTRTCPAGAEEAVALHQRPWMQMTAWEGLGPEDQTGQTVVVLMSDP